MAARGRFSASQSHSVRRYSSSEVPEPLHEVWPYGTQV